MALGANCTTFSSVAFVQKLLTTIKIAVDKNRYLLNPIYIREATMF